MVFSNPDQDINQNEIRMIQQEVGYHFVILKHHLVKMISSHLEMVAMLFYGH